MPDILCRCPRCSKNLVVDGAAAGRMLKCVDCNTPLQVPIASIAFKCPSCTWELSAPAGLAGERFLCPNCEQELVVPSSGRSDAAHPRSGVGMPLPRGFARQPSGRERDLRMPREALRDVRQPLELARAETAPEAIWMRCPSCGGQMLADAVRCGHCGSSLDGRGQETLAGAEKPSGEHAPSPNSNKLWLGAGVLMLFGGLLLAGALLGSGRGFHSSRHPAVDRFMSTWTQGNPSAVAALLDSRSPVSADIIGRFDIRSVSGVREDGEETYVLREDGESVATEEYIASTVMLSEGCSLPLRIRVGVAKDSGRVFSLYFFDDL